MLKYIKSFFVTEKDPPNPYLEWHENVKDFNFCPGLSHRVIETKDGKRIMITNLNKDPYTICAVFKGEQITPSHKTEKGYKFPENLSYLNDEGEVYAITVNGSQEIEFVKGTWTNVKFILIQIGHQGKPHFAKAGAIAMEIDRVISQGNCRNEVGSIAEMLQEGYLAEGTKEFNLHRACGGGCYAIAKLLIASGLNVNGVHNYQIANGYGSFATKSDVRDETPIHVAVNQGHLEVVKLLAESGCDLEPKMVGPKTSWLGDTPRDLAIKNGNTDIQNFITTAIAERKLKKK